MTVWPAAWLETRHAEFPPAPQQPRPANGAAGTAGEAGQTASVSISEPCRPNPRCRRNGVAIAIGIRIGSPTTEDPGIPGRARTSQSSRRELEWPSCEAFEGSGGPSRNRTGVQGFCSPLRNHSAIGPKLAGARAQRRRGPTRNCARRAAQTEARQSERTSRTHGGRQAASCSRVVGHSEERFLGSGRVRDRARHTLPPRNGTGTVREDAREIDIYHTCDVAVIGGGPAGCAAAWAAAKAGADVTLIERYNCLGGLSTGGLVMLDRPHDRLAGQPRDPGLRARVHRAHAARRRSPGRRARTGARRDPAKVGYWGQRTTAFHGIVQWAPTLDPERMKLNARRCCSRPACGSCSTLGRAPGGRGRHRARA